MQALLAQQKATIHCHIAGREINQSTGFKIHPHQEANRQRALLPVLKEQLAAKGLQRIGNPVTGKMGHLARSQRLNHGFSG